MKGKLVLVSVGIAALGALATAAAISQQDKYSLKVPGGMAFSEFRGYEKWQLISASTGKVTAVILGNPAMIKALEDGIPDNGKPFPDGAKMAKIHWNHVKAETEPGQPLVPDTLHDVDFMAKDAKRFADGAGWGYAEFVYDNAAGEFRPGNTTDDVPQANDAKCGAACHKLAAQRDSVFTRFPKR